MRKSGVLRQGCDGLGHRRPPAAVNAEAAGTLRHGMRESAKGMMHGLDHGLLREQRGLHRVGEMLKARDLGAVDQDDHVGRVSVREGRGQRREASPVVCRGSQQRAPGFGARAFCGGFPHVVGQNRAPWCLAGYFHGRPFTSRTFRGLPLAYRASRDRQEADVEEVLSLFVSTKEPALFRAECGSR